MIEALIVVVILAGMVGSFLLGLTIGIGETLERLEAAGLNRDQMEKILDESLRRGLK